MNSLGRRIGRLEARFGMEREPRVVITTINSDTFSEDACTVKLFPAGPWAFAERGSGVASGL